MVNIEDKTMNTKTTLKQIKKDYNTTGWEQVIPLRNGKYRVDNHANGDRNVYTLKQLREKHYYRFVFKAAA